MFRERGLTEEEANIRLEKYGSNEIRDISKTTSFKILLRQIKNNFIVYLLAAASIISFSVGKSITGYTILAVIFMVIIVGFIQEYRAEKAISALKQMLVPVSIVIRDGKEQEIPSLNLVPEDIIILRNGEKIPADCLLLEERELRVDESILTGESGEIKKKPITKKNDLENYSDENLIFMGSHIINGRCIAKVMHTGMNTQFGKIAGLISTTEKELPLQKKVNSIASYMVIVAITVSILTGLLMLLRATTVNQIVMLNILILVIALCVSAFPEGFPVVLLTTLAVGAQHMAKQNAIVNRMSIIETLGETTVICSDKTGTITKGEMTVKKIFTDSAVFEVSGTGYENSGNITLNNVIYKNIILNNYNNNNYNKNNNNNNNYNKNNSNKDDDYDYYNNENTIDISKKSALSHLMYGAVLCNDAIIARTGNDNEFKTIGSPTESSLLILGAKANIFKEDIKFSRLQEIPFNSERKLMTVMCNIEGEKIIYSKGALEYLLEKCGFIEKNNKILKLTESEKKKILEINRGMALNSLRTVAFAYKKNNIKSAKNEFEKDLVFIGFVGMEDPAREGVKEAVNQCFSAGIKVKMITGDNKETAQAIAKEIGLNGKLIEGYELDNITDEELPKIINSVVIFARVKPEHKLRIVQALKSNGEIVTMTGDGVNDAPALKEAHIGIAMGKNGTDVSRSVADLTLKDDNFNTIVSAIREGRSIFKNIRKFAAYQLSCNLAELLILFIGVLLQPLLGWQIPILMALQILFMNLVTDNLPAITLGLNPASSDSMLEQPRKKSEILNKKLFILLVFTSILLMGLTLLSYFIAFNILEKDQAYARTTALFTLILLEIASAFNFRSFRKGVFNRSPLVNPYLFYASLISIIATTIIIYTPANKIFETVPLGIDGLIIVVSSAFVLIAVYDILKYINNKKQFFSLEHI